MPVLKPSFPRIYRRSDAPVAWFLMDQPRRTFPGDSGDVADLVGAVPAGSRVGGCAWSNGPFGSTLSFNGATGSVHVPANPLIQRQAPFSIACAFRATNPSGGIQQLFRAGGISYGYSLHIGVNTGQVGFGLSAGGDQAIFAAIDSRDHVVVGTYDGSLMSLYLDGVLAATQAASGTQTYSDSPRIGSGSASGSDIFFLSGLIHWLAVYPRILPAAEIARNYADPFWRLRKPKRFSIFLPPPPIGGTITFSARSTINAGATLIYLASAAWSGISAFSGAGTVTILAALILAGHSSLFTTGSVVSTVTIAQRDWAILSDIRDRLEATGEFDGVHLSGPPEGWGRSSGESRMAICALSGWDDTDEWDDASDVSIPRSVTWTLTLFVRQSDPESRDREADRLANVAQNVLDGQSLAGITLPGLTKIRRGRWDRAIPPERRLVLTGEFTYFVDGFAGHDTTE